MRFCGGSRQVFCYTKKYIGIRVETNYMPTRPTSWSVLSHPQRGVHNYRLSIRYPPRYARQLSLYRSSSSHRLIVSSFVPKRKPHRPPSVSVKSVAGCCGSAPIYALRSVPRHQSSYRISVPHHLSDHRSFIVSGFFVLQWIAEAFFFASAFIVAVAVAVAVLAPSTSVLKRIDDFGGGARENKKKVRGN
jgi:hypothetical protein